MSTSAVSSTTSSTGTNLSSVISNNTTLGKDDFLKLLVTELSNQDPLNPMDNTEYVAQLAQFSSLEQMTNISESSESTNKSMSATRAFSLIGRNIEWANTDGEANGTGTVTGVSFTDGVPSLNVGSKTVDISNIVKVEE